MVEPMRIPLIGLSAIAASALSGCNYFPTSPKINTLTDGVAVTVSGGEGSIKHYSLSIPTGAPGLRVRLSGGSGDADLYLRQGTRPTADVHDCASEETGNTEECLMVSPVAGTWHVAVVAYEAFAGLELIAEVVTPPALHHQR
jgi:hypothetical protein